MVVEEVVDVLDWLQSASDRNQPRQRKDLERVELLHMIVSIIGGGFKLGLGLCDGDVRMDMDGDVCFVLGGLL